MSRQTRRAAERRQKKTALQAIGEAKRKARGRALLGRQARREKEGFYDGLLTVAVALVHRRAGRLYRRVLRDDTGKAKYNNLVRLG